MRKNNKKEGKPVAKAKSQYTIYNVKEPAELMAFLMKQMDGLSRTSVKTMLSKRRVFVDNQITTLHNFELKPGMKVQISKYKNNKEFHSSLIKLLYEDAYLLVVEKKENLLSAPTSKLKERSAHSILSDYVKKSAKERRVYTIHRLDKEASGLMMFAKDEKTSKTILDYWDEIVTDQRFVAVLEGETEKEHGVVSSWLQEDKIMVAYSDISQNNKDAATTYYKTIKRRNGYSLVELKSLNGKKLQLRGHAADLKHPIVGDEKYGNGENPLKRLALHAFKLDFYHPITGEPMKFETPYPSSFKSLLIKKAAEKADNN